MNISTPWFAPFAGLPNRRPKLLLVDDQTANIQLLNELFACTCQVFMATSGQQALAHCFENQPDLVLLDVLMPDMGGHEVCRQLKAHEDTRDLPIIFITGQDEPPYEATGLAIGAVDFISKPFDGDVVRARVRTHLTLKFQADALRSMVFLDGLTGVYNRRYFDDQLAREWKRAKRAQTDLAVVLMDVDFFKRYNDHYGHLAGDDCLRSVAHTLQDKLRRAADFIARYGGEEFVCLLPNTTAHQAMLVAQHLEAAVRERNTSHAKSDAASCVTVSLGVAWMPSDGSGEPLTMLAQADAQLYRAKSTGRGRACGEGY